MRKRTIVRAIGSKRGLYCTHMSIFAIICRRFVCSYSVKGLQLIVAMRFQTSPSGISNVPGASSGGYPTRNYRVGRLPVLTRVCGWHPGIRTRDPGSGYSAPLTNQRPRSRAKWIFFQQLDVYVSIPRPFISIPTTMPQQITLPTLLPKDPLSSSWPVT